jgi:hypothetical protein
MSRPNATRIALLAAALGVAALVLFLYPRGKTRHIAGTCRELPVVARIPGVAMDDARGLAYLAYLDAEKRANGRPPRGTVMLLDLNVPEPGVRAALVTDPPDFQPVALSLYVPESGPRRLFVVDRGTGAQGGVRIFEQSPSGAFELAKTVQDPLLASPIAITAKGPDKFYVRSAATGGFARLRAMLGSPRFTIAYYDGSHVITEPADAPTAMSAGATTTDRVYENAKAHTRLQVIEGETQSELALCSATAVSGD